MSTLEQETRRLRVATYNIHKCRGVDRRVRPERIAEVLDELDADLVALQEVVGPGRAGEDPSRCVADGRGYHAVFGRNRAHRGAAYGNLLLSRFPVLNFCNYNITSRGREPRGVLRVDVRVGTGRVLHLFNVHLGTASHERREQARHLVGERILGNAELTGPRILLGDFNEWFPGLASRLLAAHFQQPKPRSVAARRRTYPGFLPLLRLDHVYFDPDLRLRRLAPHRSRKALVASDHLPILADFDLRAPAGPPFRARGHYVADPLAGCRAGISSAGTGL